ncbi:ferredoxin [Kitasatospora brasiliensis]|uniref:ferredoxin n=1 Tax=Kitasatospora brasiliensis TaxID=3058040 RepID=UPI00292D8D30|nr:ferredoxin [Kitasatospora sp. K002]
MTTPAGSVRISIDRTRCVGSGQCVMAAPELFDQDDDGLIVVLDPEPGPDLVVAARTAAQLCPGAVVTLDGA